MAKLWSLLDGILERISNRCAIVSAVSEVMGAFNQPELANKLSKSHQGYRRCWVDSARFFKNGARCAKGRPGIASTRQTYPPPCPPPQGGRKRCRERAVEKKANIYSRSFCPVIFLWIEITFMIRVTLPPPLWGRAGWGVPKNKIAALKKWFPTAWESENPIGMALLLGCHCLHNCWPSFFNPSF